MAYPRMTLLIGDTVPASFLTSVRRSASQGGLRMQSRPVDRP